MTSKAVVDITYDDIDAAGALIFDDDNGQLTVMLAPWVKNFMCAAWGNTYERSTYGNHWYDRKDTATGEPMPRCMGKQNWDSFKKSQNKGQVVLIPKKVRPVYSVYPIRRFLFLICHFSLSFFIEDTSSFQFGCISELPHLS